jgi:hypothetical protein
MESAWHPLWQSLSGLLFGSGHLKAVLGAAGAMLVLVSGDEHFRRRVIGLGLMIGSHWCP